MKQRQLALSAALLAVLTAGVVAALTWDHPSRPRGAWRRSCVHLVGL